MNKILVLSGGGTPGICVHAGALKSLYERRRNFNIVIGLIAFIGGLIWGHVYWTTGGTILSIWLCVALHMIFVRFIYGRGPKVGYRGLFRKLTGR